LTKIKVGFAAHVHDRCGPIADLPSPQEPMMKKTIAALVVFSVAFIGTGWLSRSEADPSPFSMVTAASAASDAPTDKGKTEKKKKGKKSKGDKGDKDK
jgi:hypothetical protein